MPAISLGFHTDLTVARLAGSERHDAGDHVVVRTAREPEFRWGNFVLVPGRSASDAERWLAVFAAAFPDAGHVAIGVDSDDPTDVDLAGYAAAGVEAQRDSVLTATEGARPDAPLPQGALIRPLRSRADWAELTDLRLVTFGEAGGSMRRFVIDHQGWSRQLVATGAARWWGLWADGELRSSLGVVADGTGTARYQTVETHPDWRRRGAAGWLVHTAGRDACRAGARRLVIVADPDGPAVGLYRRLGFADTAMELFLERAGPAPEGAGPVG